MATSTLTEVRLRSIPLKENSVPNATNNDISKLRHNSMEGIGQISDASSHVSHQTSSSKSFSCFIHPNEESRQFWKTPIKFFHIAARELSVLLILIETLILLAGYLMILGVHYSIRYCLSKIRHKTFPDDNVSYMHERNYQRYARPVVPRRVPRGRMAGG